MTKKTFYINDWLKKVPENKAIQPAIKTIHAETDIDTVICRIEEMQIDITTDYHDWLSIGFAFACEFGESGRGYFHRISRFNSDYRQSECDKQYTNCLKSNGGGINIGTFYHLVKQAGINIACHSPVPNNATSTSKEKPETVKDRSHFSTPHLPAEVYGTLPEILKDSAELFSEPVEKDVFLMGSLAVLSGCLPNIKGLYFNEWYTPHLFVFVTAPAGSGKGIMKWAKFFGQAIHDQMLDESYNAKVEYEVLTENYNNLPKSERENAQKPEEPRMRMFYIPANSSNSALTQALSDNNFSGVIFETEADTLSSTFKQEWGNFSDILRKAFHHETTSMFRRKDNEFIEIKNPHIAIALSGTPRQVQTMLPDSENGLFSRFLFYAFEDKSEFKNPFAYNQLDYTEFFQSKAEEVKALYNMLNSLPSPVDFTLEERHKTEFKSIFTKMLNRNRSLIGCDFDASVKRLGLISFRIAMLFTALRTTENGELPEKLVCSDQDFSNAVCICTCLEKHIISVYQQLPNSSFNGIKQQYYDSLPEDFDRQTYLEVAQEQGIKPKTAEKYINVFKSSSLLDHSHNKYSKRSA